MNKLSLIPCLLVSLTVLAQASAKPAPKQPSASPTPTKSVSTSKQSWEAKWDKMVEAARAEGKIVLYANLDADEKNSMEKAFKARYGISIDLLSGSAAEVAAKITSERSAGLYVPDVNMSGVVGSIILLKPKGFTEKLDDVLIRPDIKNPALWLNNRFPWTDSDHTQVQFIGEVFPGITINNQIVGPNEIKSYEDLLAEKWKGKITMIDPTIASSGSQWFAKFTIALGENYMRAFARQAPMLSRDSRLSVEWVARGKYPVGVALHSTQVWKFLNEGAPITVIDTEIGALSPQHGCVTLMKNAPHPNAAKVFVNWLLTKEGQEAFSRGALAPSRRLDVSTKGVVPFAIPKPGRKYIEDDEETLAQRDKMAELAKTIFQPLVK